MGLSDLPSHICLDQSPWQPHLDNSVMAMGLKRIDPSAWLQREGLPLQAYAYNKKEETQRQRQKVLQVLPRAADAVEECAQMIASSLNTTVSQASSAEELFYATSMAVAEDICLLQANEQGYCLDAAHLCAPSHWLLEDKIGRAMDPVHEPVPDYQNKLARSVNSFLSKLPEQRIVERFNWSVDELPLLCQRPSHLLQLQPPPEKSVLSWYRVERQTLRRLPKTGAIVFTILVRHWPLWFLAEQSGGRAGLERALEQLPPALRDYKNLSKGAVLNWSKP